MSYAIIEIDVTHPLPKCLVLDGYRGIAVLLRRNHVPIDFWLERLPDNRRLTSGDLARRIDRYARVKLLTESIREELLPKETPARLPSLSVAICTKDRCAYLAQCLRSLRCLRAPDGAALPRPEILVVDNAPSDDRTRELIASLPDVRYIRESKPGLDFARNRALQEAGGDLLAFLDDDVVVDRGWLAGLMAAWAENPDAAAFTGLVLPHALTTRAQILFEMRGGFGKGFDKIRYCGPNLPGAPLYPCGPGIFGTGCNMAFRRAVLRELGGFDEALDTGKTLPGGGDLDIFYRVIRAGYALVYEPRYLVFHCHRREITALRRQYWSWGLGFMAFVAKSYRQDPTQRAKFRRLVVWWFKDQWRLFVKSLIGRHVLPPDMVLAELSGGIVGLLGEYSRSRRRIASIK